MLDAFILAIIIVLGAGIGLLVICVIEATFDTNTQVHHIRKHLKIHNIFDGTYDECNDCTRELDE